MSTPIQEGWDDVKAWYKSKTIWGVLITLIGTAVQIIWPEYVGSIGTAPEVIIEEGDKIVEAANNVWGSVVQFIGLAVAAWGRFKAHVAIK